MFDLGFQELIVIFIVALLVFGPEKLPELARNMGKAVGGLKRAITEAKGELDREAGISDLQKKYSIPSIKEDLMGSVNEGVNPPAREGGTPDPGRIKPEAGEPEADAAPKEDAAGAPMAGEVTLPSDHEGGAADQATGGDGGGKAGA